MKHLSAAYLKELNEIHTELVVVGHSQVDARWKGRIDMPDVSRLYYVVSGGAVIRSESGELLMKSGEWYILPSGVSFDYLCPHKMDHVFFHLKLCGRNGIDLLGRCKEPLPVRVSDTLTREIVDKDAESIAEGLELRTRLSEILIGIVAEREIALEEAKLSPHTEAAVKYIGERLSMSLVADEIARAVSISKSSLTKKFRAELGTSVGEYIRSAVLSEARLLVSDGKMPIGEISDRLGFSDQFYFSKKFKERFGVSPREYRKKPFA